MRLTHGIILSVLAVSLSAGVIACGGGGGGGGNGGDGSVQRLAFYTSTDGPGDMSSWPEVSGSGLTGLEAAVGICMARAAAGHVDCWVDAFVDQRSVEHDFEVIGKKKMVLSARRVARKGKKTENILLAIDDVTERGGG